MTPDLPRSAVQSYDCVAAEYYDTERHPTCSNFGELSERFIASRFPHKADSWTTILEVGAGRSMVAPLMTGVGLQLDRLTLLDCSSVMLAYSQPWACSGAKLVVADAQSTGLARSSFNLIVASLGDPYNRLPFWQEVSRLLRSGGICLFTSPAFEWASRFRGGDSDYAEFLLRE